MFNDKIFYTTTFGYIELESEEKPLICNDDLFKEELFSSTTINYIKIWFGTPPGEKNIKSILGLKIKYKNYLTGEVKDTNYQGYEINGDDVDTKELEIKEGQYLSYFNITFNKYIDYIKIGTKKKWIEFGDYNEEKQIVQLEELNSGNNIILNLKGLFSKKGIRNLGCDYIPYKYFFFIRTQIIFRLRYRLYHDKKFQDKYSNRKELDKLNNEMKLILKICQLPKSPFTIFIKYL